MKTDSTQSEVAERLRLSRLGFGTASLMSRVNRRDSVRLVQTAFDCGITHFDTARSYGFGEAEAAVGEFVQGRRDAVTLTTKVGILPPRRSAGLSLAKTLARQAISMLPSVRAAVRRSAGTLVQAGRFDTQSMTESLNTSLRQLRTDYVDLLLLHEPWMDVLLTEEPLAFLRRMQEQGKARAIGIAATAEVAAFALERAPEYAGAIQMPCSVLDPMPADVLLGQGRTVITHSALGTGVLSLRGDLAGDPERARRWSEKVGVDVAQPGALEGLALQWSLAASPGSTVLFASTQPEHIRQNAAALVTAASGEQIEWFQRMVREWMQRR